MANLKQTGVRISQYQVAQINDGDKKGKLLLNHNLISYAPSYFGTSTMNKNYQIPIQSIRDDFKGYLGVENAKGNWQNSIRIWSGNWNDTIENRENSYIYQWNYEDRGNLDYIENKWGDEEDVDKIFLLKTAPWPAEYEDEKVNDTTSLGQDPNHSSNKFVNKDYVDNRHNGLRKVVVTNDNLEIRPYPCVYTYEQHISHINISDSLVLENGTTVKELIANNCVIFYIRTPFPETDNIVIRANNKPVKWSYPTELDSILDAAEKNGKTDLLIQCYGEYINGDFVVRCSNALNSRPGAEKVPDPITITDRIEDGNTHPCTSDAVWHHVKDELAKIKPDTDTVTDGEDNAVPTSNAVYDFVKDEISKIIIDTTDTIEDDSQEIPTSDAVYEFVDGKFATIDELFEKWHSDNDYTHINANVQSDKGDMADNLEAGDNARGIIIKLPDSCTLTKIVLGGVPRYGSNYAFFAKITDPITNKVLGVSTKTQASGIIKLATYINFPDGVYLIKDREYKITFHSKEDSETADHTFYVAYGNAQSWSSGEIYDLGQFVPKIITTDNTIKSAPSSWKASDETVYKCNGYKALVEYTSVGNKEFVDVTDEISNIYVALNQTDAASGAEIKSIRDDFNNHVSQYNRLNENFNAYIESNDSNMAALQTHKTEYEDKANKLSVKIDNLEEQHSKDYQKQEEAFGQHNTNGEIHVTTEDKARWDGTLTNLKGGDCVSITDNTISVITSGEIVNSAESVPTSSVVYAHNSNKQQHLIDGQKDILFTSIPTISNIIGTGADRDDTPFGIVIEPKKDMKVHKIEYRGLWDGDIMNNARALYIWQNTENGIVRLKQFSTLTTGSRRSICDFGESILFKKDNTYFLTYHTALNDNITKVEYGYKNKITTYNSSTDTSVYLLKASSSGSVFTMDNIDRTKTTNFTFHVEDEYSNNVMLSEEFNDKFDERYEDKFDESFSEKFPESFASEWNNTFNGSFTSAFTEQFTPSFNNSFSSAFDTRFNNSFPTAFDTRFNNSFQTAFDTRFPTAFDTRFNNSFPTAFDTRFSTNFNNSFPTAFDTRFNNSFPTAFDTRLSEKFEDEFDKIFDDKFSNSLSEKFSAEFETNFASTFDDALHNALYEGKETAWLESDKTIQATLGSSCGVGFIPTETFNAYRLSIPSLNAKNTSYVKVRKIDGNEVTHLFYTKISTEENKNTWSFDEYTFEKGVTYSITFHSNTISDTEIGYSWTYSTVYTQNNNFGHITNSGSQNGNKPMYNPGIAPYFYLIGKDNGCVFVEADEFKPIKTTINNLDSTTQLHSAQISEIATDVSAISENVDNIIASLQDVYTLSQTNENISFGSLNRDEKCNARGIIIVPEISGTFNQITINGRKADSSERSYENILLRINELQDDGTVVEIATSYNREEGNYQTGNFINVTHKFDTFNMTKGKTYYCEFLQTEDDEVTIKSERAEIKVGLVRSSNGTGVINASQTGSWGNAYVGSYTPTYQVEFVGDSYPITESTTHVLKKFVIHKNGSMSNDTILLNPIISTTLGNECEHIMKNNSILISTPKTTEVNYVVFKMFYIDTIADVSGEIIKHYSI